MVHLEDRKVCEQVDLKRVKARLVDLGERGCPAFDWEDGGAENKFWHYAFDTLLEMICAMEAGGYETVWDLLQTLDDTSDAVESYVQMARGCVESDADHKISI